MPQPQLALYTQTPLARFEPAASLERPSHALSEWREGVDYHRSPGGVTRMVEPLLRRLVASGRVECATWFSLARHGPSRVGLAPGVEAEHVKLPAVDLVPYAAAKQAYWDAIHGRDEGFDAAAVHRGLDRLSAWLALKTFRRPEAPYDLSYVHDFQLLPLARHLPRGAPKVFRWHVPVPPPGPALDYAVRSLSAYDAVIVSTHAYREAFLRAGVTAPVHAMYPFLDERRPHVVTPQEVARFQRTHGLASSEVVFLLVARLDPAKAHDVAIRAFARVARSLDGARLVCVGGGGFSAGRGGIGLTHARTLREELVALAASLGVADKVVFTGGIQDRELDVAYTRADAVLLPSTVEGFGLVAVEGWLFGKPVVVSDGAGVAELVVDGANGYTFPSGDDAALAGRMLAATASREHALALGARGRATAEACELASATDRVWGVLEGTLEGRRLRRAI